VGKTILGIAALFLVALSPAAAAQVPTQGAILCLPCALLGSAVPSVCDLCVCGDGECNDPEDDTSCPEDCGCASFGGACPTDTPAGRTGCYCDSDCVRLEDCCADACEVCGQCP
jgi:hypothetical protein